MYQTSSNGTRTKRRPTRIAITAVLLGAMLSSTLVANAEEPTFRSAKTSAVNGLPAIIGLDTQNEAAALTGLDLHDQKTASHDQKRLDKALKELNKGLADKYWAPDGETLVGKGEHVFRRDARAIRHLEKIKDLDVGGIANVQAIVQIDFEMAQAAVAAAKAARADSTVDTTKVDRTMDKINRTMEKAAEARAAGDLSKAVDLYGTAWRNADRAMPKAPKASTTSAVGGMSLTGPADSNGKYSTYEVVLVLADTVNDPEPEFIAVSGSNQPGTRGYAGKSTEGYLYSPRFGPGDTFLDSSMWATPKDYKMQLHVSCSDVFAGGFGSKSDPAETSEWMINSIHIVKHQGASIDKECVVIGAGLTTPPPDTIANATTPPPSPEATTTAPTTTSTTTTQPPDEM